MGPVDPGRSTLQRRAWENTLLRQAAIDAPGDVFTADPDSSTERPISMSELPPPPDFLLENSLIIGGQGEDNVGARPFDTVGRVGPVAAVPRLFEVADGYRSGDSVDDDIDDLDYTIRAPSVHGRLYA
jgi:hypothetical protein